MSPPLSQITSPSAFPSAHTVVCGAGIAGIAVAHSLAVTHGIRDVVVVDEGPPMSLTSDKSSECYRNWWPGPDDAMVQLINRSIDMLEAWSVESQDRFRMNRRGYLYATADTSKIPHMMDLARHAEAHGAGPLRVYRSVDDAMRYQPSSHTGYQGMPSGGDLFVDRDAIRAHFPYLSHDVVAVLHARRCGWFSGQQLGMYLLESARAAGVRFVSGKVTDVVVTAGQVAGVTILSANGESTTIDTSRFVNAAGPHARAVSRLVGVDLPIFSELHLKLAFEDTLGVVNRDSGLVIFDDEQLLDWSDEEREELAAHDETRWLTQTLPAGVHLRPEGYHNSQTVVMLWDYHSHEHYDPPIFPIPDDPYYTEVVMRGLSRLIPALAPYVERVPKSFIDGGYYTKTVENRPLIGSLPVAGAYVCAALSGFGLMAAPAAGELLAAQIVGHEAPAYAKAFLLSRYDDLEYVALVASWGDTGQL